MKKFVNAAVFAIVLGAPTLAGSAVPSSTAVYSQTRLDPMSDCELAFYMACMKAGGSHVYCMDQVAMHVCLANQSDGNALSFGSR